ncbi:outer membrane beta-barrel protein [Armatimonas sp.]|uniref:outer membrane beta-barrel protein n=1 Tax=Armatimonas sp. TaxID=1872638 RepID=UPI003750F451
MRTRLQFVLAALGVASLAPSAFAQGVTVGGQLEANYTYNFNKPNTRNNTFLFNTTDGQFTVNLGEISVSRAVADDKAGFVLRLITGRVQEAFHAAYGTDNILEAYGSTKRSMGGKEMTLDFGQFLSHVGYETPDVGTGHFLSKSFQYQYLQPFVNAGLRGTVPLSGKTSLTGVVANRFDGVKAGASRDLAVGFQIKRTSDASSISLNTMFSRANMGTMAAPLNRQNNVANIVYTNKLSESTAIAVDATMRSGKDAANRTYNATGFTGYLTKTLSNANVLGLRAEYLTQNNATSGILPGYPTAPARKPTMNSITASYELSGAFPGARTLLEFRADRAGGALFPGEKAGTVKQDQTSVTFSQIFKI